MRPLAAALATLSLCAACGSDFDPVTRVTDFRLLAVRADKPFAAPGEDVTLTTLYEEPFDRPITWGWTACVNPPDSTVNACLLTLLDASRAGAAPALAVGSGLDAFVYKVPDDALSSLPPEARAAATIGIVTVGCPGRLETRASGDAELPFRCFDAVSGAELPFERFVVSVKRINVRARDRNAAPNIAEVTWAGTPWPEGEVREAGACDKDSNDFADCKTGADVRIVALPAPGAAEEGTDEFGQAFKEQVVIQYFATEGTFEFDGRPLDTAALGTRWVARARARGREVTMWFVIRDSRGAVSWTTRQIRVKG